MLRDVLSYHAPRTNYYAVRIVGLYGIRQQRRLVVGLLLRSGSRHGGHLSFGPTVWTLDILVRARFSGFTAFTWY